MATAYLFYRYFDMADKTAHFVFVIVIMSVKAS